MAYINTLTGEYPLTEEQVRARFPHILFPVVTPFTPPYPYVEVAATPQPVYDLLTQRIAEWPPVKNDVGYVQVWGIMELPAEEIKANQKAAILSQIKSLEIQQTPRRIREATLGTDNGWLANLDAQIQQLRATIPD